MSDELDPQERRLRDLFRQVEAPVSTRRWETGNVRAARRRPRWARPVNALFTTGGERRLRPLAAALVLPLLVLAIGGGLQLRAHFASSTAGTPGDPPAREYAAMAFDAAHGQVVMFGGDTTDNGFALLGDTWTWDGSSWSQQHPAHSPSARTRAAMAFDAAHGAVVLTGGSGPTANSPSGALDDTWTWDGSDWRQLQTAHPAGGDVVGMAYDQATQQLVLVTQSVRGGFSPPQGMQPLVPQPHAVQQLTPVAGAATGLPTPRAPANGTPTIQHLAPMPVQGGSTSVQFIAKPSSLTVQSWTWTGSDWQPRSPHTQPGGEPHLLPMAYDATAHRVVLLTVDPMSSACAAALSAGGPARAITEPAPRGSAGWTGYTAATPAATPSPMAGGGAGDCSPLRVGTQTSGPPCYGCGQAHQWSWDGSDWHESVLGKDVTMLLGTELATNPSGHLVAVDSGATYVWNGSSWTRHVNPLQLAHRGGMALATDTAHGVVVLFGGRGGASDAGDTWTWDGTTWTHRSGAVPVAVAPTPGRLPAPLVSAVPLPICGAPAMIAVGGGSSIPGEVSISVRLAPSSQGCTTVPQGGVVWLVDAFGGHLDVQGNGVQVVPGQNLNLVWGNWCGAQSGSVQVQQGKAAATTYTLSQFPACTNRSQRSALTVVRPGSSSVVP